MCSIHKSQENKNKLELHKMNSIFIIKPNVAARPGSILQGKSYSNSYAQDPRVFLGVKIVSFERTHSQVTPRMTKDEKLITKVIQASLPGQ